MRRSEYINLAVRLLAHVDNGTTDSAEDVKYIPVENYVDPVRWQREMDTIFKRLPLLLAFTCEMREPGDYKSVGCRRRARSYCARAGWSRAGIHRGLLASWHSADRRR